LHYLQTVSSLLKLKREHLLDALFFFLLKIKHFLWTEEMLVAPYLPMFFEFDYYYGV